MHNSGFTSKKAAARVRARTKSRAEEQLPSCRVLPVSLMSAKVAMMVENEGRFSRDYQILKQSSAEIAEEQGASRGVVLIARR